MEIVELCQCFNLKHKSLIIYLPVFLWGLNFLPIFLCEKLSQIGWAVCVYAFKPLCIFHNKVLKSLLIYQ